MSRGPWERHKPAEYYSATDFEKLQWACGIPARYWNIRMASIRASSDSYAFKDNTRESVSSSLQMSYLKERVKNPDLLQSNRLVCFSSYPTDEHAMAAACLLANAYMAKAWREDRPAKVRVDDIQDYEKALKLDKLFYPVVPDIIILYNFNDNSSRERLSLARDILLEFEGKYRAIVASSDSALKFARDKIYCEPQEIYNFEKTPRKVVTR